MMEDKKSVGGRPKDTFIDGHILSIIGEDGKVVAKKCNYCGQRFSNKTSVTRFKAHLGGVPGYDVAFCKMVPSIVKEAAKNAMPSSSTGPRPSKMVQAGPSTPNIPHHLGHTHIQQPHPHQNLEFCPFTFQQPPFQAKLQELERLIFSPHDDESPLQHDMSEDHEGLQPSPNTMNPTCIQAQLTREHQNSESLSLAPLQPQYMTTELRHEPFEMPLYTSQTNSSCSMNGTLASQLPVQQHPGEDPSYFPYQGVLQDAARINSMNDAIISQNFLQEGAACSNSLPHSTHEEGMLTAEFENYEGLESQHVQENLQEDERISPLDCSPYPSMVPQMHHMHIESLLESLDTPTSTPSQAEYKKKRKFLDQRPTGKIRQTGKIFRSPTINESVEEISKSLEDDSVNRVGIYGMGGSGKTTIMTLIHNLLLEGSFMHCSHVIWVKVTQNYTVSKLQHHLASLLKVTLSHDENEEAWAASLYEEMRKMHYALILDDVWDEINLIQVGIPEPTRDNRCKLILTTRSLNVCKGMQCKPIYLNLLSRNEAWELFVETLNVNPNESTLEGIMKEVAKECANLPLAIVTIAGSMRGIDDVHEWRYALESLRDRTYGFTDMKEQVMENLKFSYYRLSEQLQKCLLSCALYPEGSVIKKHKLIMMLIMEGTIQSNKSLKSAYDHGQTILNKLENVCLLTCGSFDTFVIHDLIRDMCLDIMGGCFLVKCNSEFPPDESEYTEVLEKVSLMNSKFEEICLNIAPNCPKLSTLLLPGNLYLTRISDSFFMGFPELKVLNLSGTSIQVLPSSVTNLTSLNALVLRYCSKLRCLPCLTPLKALKLLDLYESGIEEVPEGLKNLVNLTCLYLCGTAIKSDSSLVVTNLVKLQRLVLSNEVKIVMKGMKELKNLDAFVAKFANWEDFSEYVSFMLNSERGPSDYQIEADFTCVGASFVSMSYKVSAGKRYIEILDGSISREHEREERRVRAWLYLRDYNRREEDWLFLDLIGQIPSPEIVQELRIYRQGSNNLHQGKTEEKGELKGLFDATFCLAFTNLVELLVQGFNFTKDLISASSLIVESSSSSPKVLPCFQNLQVLRIGYCENLESIVSSANPTEKEESNNPINFPNLRNLYLWELPNWRSILFCPSIQYIAVDRCPKLNRFPVQLLQHDYDSWQLTPPLRFLNEIEGNSNWWQSLEWDQPHAKALLQPHFYPFTDDIPYLSECTSVTEEQASNFRAWERGFEFDWE